MTYLPEYIAAVMGDQIAWVATVLVIYTLAVTLRDVVSVALHWYRDRND